MISAQCNTIANLKSWLEKGPQNPSAKSVKLQYIHIRKGACSSNLIMLTGIMFHLEARPKESNFYINHFL